MKKDYLKPEIRVVKLKEIPRLLQGSDPEPKKYRRDFGYVPGLGDETNALA